MRFVREFSFEVALITTVLMLISCIIFLHIRIGRIRTDDIAVKCESLFYISETPKDSMLVIRAAPECAKFQ